MHFGQLIINIDGPALTPFEEKAVSHPLLGGIILLNKNFSTPQALTALIARLKYLRAENHQPPLLISIDHEGGLVKRFSKEVLSPLPSAHAIGNLYTSAPAKALYCIKNIAIIQAFELSKIGINTNFSPVLDINTSPYMQEKERCFSNEPDVISALTERYLQTMCELNFHCVGKHFPGLGMIPLDNHYSFGIIQKTATETLNTHIQPFERAIAKGVMKSLIVTHGVLPQRSLQPFSTSSYWLCDVLKDRLGFNGLIFADCICMRSARAISPYFHERFIKCLTAGCDFVIATCTPAMEKTFFSEAFFDKMQRDYLNSPQYFSSQKKIKRLIEALDCQVDKQTYLSAKAQLSSSQT